MTTNRDHALEAAKGIFMLLGILLHGASWVHRYLEDQTTFEWHVLKLTEGFISTFRMPAFFLIAGYFLAIGLLKYPPKALMEKKVLRLLLPAIATLLTFNQVESYLHGGQWHLATGFGHLWFIVVLFAITALFCLIPIAFFQTAARQLEELPSIRLFSAAIALILAVKFVVISSGVAYVPFMSVTLNMVGTYLPYVFIGMMLCLSKDIQQRCLSMPIWPILFTIPTIYFIRPLMKEVGTLLTRELVFVAVVILTLITVFAVIGFFRRCFSTESRVTSFLSDTSYTVFLFHHMLIILFLEMLNPFGLNPLARFVIGCISTFACCLMLHRYVVERFAIPRFLFTGR